jgi:hypothetical protein
MSGPGVDTEKRTAEVLASVFEHWRDRRFRDRGDAVSAIASRTGWSRELLDESIDALLAPFSRDALDSFASTVQPRERIGGFIMPANVPGAGMHELVAALISGAIAIVKTSEREPVFFHYFARTLAHVAPEVGSRLEVTSFGRHDCDRIDALKKRCDFIVALGDDANLAQLDQMPRLFAFGSRASGALISLAGPANIAALATAVARDVSLFEQQGCLSPHHIFIEGPGDTHAAEFAMLLAHALDTVAIKLPSAKLSFPAASAIRGIRESARWRSIGGQPVALREDDAMSWTVVFDPTARFTISPGFRTVTVSAIRDAEDLASRLAPIAGRLEAFGLAVPRDARPLWLDVLGGAGVTYVCDPGQMQSPPLTWPHGGGAFLDFLLARNG